MRSGSTALLLVTCLAGQSPFAGVSELRQPDRFSTADFKQERHISALSRPLVSSGTVTLSEAGFIWTQQHPFANALSFDGVSIIETTMAGSEAVSRPVRDPITENLTRTLFQMMNGSWQQMQSGFDIQQGEVSENTSWALNLIPLDDDIRSVVPSIKLSGNRFVDRILVELSQGNFTLIELSNQRPPE